MDHDIPEINDDHYLELNWGICFRIWVSLLWRSWLLGIFVGVPALLIGGYIAHILLLKRAMVGMLFGLVAGNAMGVVALWLVLKKKFTRFRIVLKKRRGKR